MTRHGAQLGTEQDRVSTASCWIHLLPKVFCIYADSILMYSWKFNKSSTQKIRKRKRSHITQICKAAEDWVEHDFELWLLYLFQEFPATSSWPLNCGRYLACQRAWQHVRRKVFRLLLEHWGILWFIIKCQSNKNWKWCTRSLYSEALSSSLG